MDDHNGCRKRTFALDVHSNGANLLKRTVKAKISEFMGEDVDEVLAEYVVVLVGHGKQEAQAAADLDVFLGDQASSFVQWLYDHLTVNKHLYIPPSEDRGVQVEPRASDHHLYAKQDQEGSPREEIEKIRAGGAPHEEINRRDQEEQGKSLLQRGGGGSGRALASVIARPDPEDKREGKVQQRSIGGRQRSERRSSPPVLLRGERDRQPWVRDRPGRFGGRREQDIWRERPPNRSARARDSGERERHSKRSRSPEAPEARKDPEGVVERLPEETSSPPRVDGARRLLQSAVRNAFTAVVSSRPEPPVKKQRVTPTDQALEKEQEPAVPQDVPPKFRDAETVMSELEGSRSHIRRQRNRRPDRRQFYPGLIRRGLNSGELRPRWGGLHLKEGEAAQKAVDAEEPVRQVMPEEEMAGERAMQPELAEVDYLSVPDQVLPISMPLHDCREVIVRVHQQQLQQMEQPISELLSTTSAPVASHVRSNAGNLPAELAVISPEKPAVKSVWERLGACPPPEGSPPPPGPSIHHRLGGAHGAVLGGRGLLDTPELTDRINAGEDPMLVGPSGRPAADLGMSSAAGAVLDGNGLLGEFPQSSSGRLWVQQAAALRIGQAAGGAVEPKQRFGGDVGTRGSVPEGRFDSHGGGGRSRAGLGIHQFEFGKRRSLEIEEGVRDAEPGAAAPAGRIISTGRRSLVAEDEHEMRFFKRGGGRGPPELGPEPVGIEDEETSGVEEMKKRMLQVQLEMTRLRARTTEVVKDLQKTPSGKGAKSGGPIPTQQDIDERSVFVSNVHFATSKDALTAHFSSCGEVLRATLLLDPITAKPKGSAYVEFGSKDAAEKALSLNESSLLLRQLKVVRKTSVPKPAVSATPQPSMTSPVPTSTPFSAPKRLPPYVGPFRGGLAGANLRSPSVFTRAKGHPPPPRQWKREDAAAASSTPSQNGTSESNGGGSASNANNNSAVAVGSELRNGGGRLQGPGPLRSVRSFSYRRPDPYTSPGSRDESGAGVVPVK